MTAGRLRERCSFERYVQVSDGAGGATGAWQAIAGLSDVRGYFKPGQAREQIEGGRLESPVAGVLKIRSSAAARGLTTADRVKINGVIHAMHAPVNPDRRGKFLDIPVERGSGDG